MDKKFVVPVLACLSLFGCAAESPYIRFMGDYSLYTDESPTHFPLEVEFVDQLATIELEDDAATLWFHNCRLPFRLQALTPSNSMVYVLDTGNDHSCIGGSVDSAMMELTDNELRFYIGLSHRLRGEWDALYWGSRI